MPSRHSVFIAVAGALALTVQVDGAAIDLATVMPTVPGAADQSGPQFAADSPLVESDTAPAELQPSSDEAVDSDPDEQEGMSLELKLMLAGFLLTFVTTVVALLEAQRSHSLIKATLSRLIKRTRPVPAAYTTWAEAVRTARATRSTPALEFVAAINREAVGYRDAYCEDREPSKRQDRLWGNVLKGDSLRPMKWFPKTASSSITAPDNVAQRLLDRLADGHRAKRPTRVWLAGNPGSGKSTILTALFFRLLDGAGDEGGTKGGARTGRAGAKGRMVPFYLRAAALETPEVHALRDAAAGDSETQFRAIVDVWLKYRGEAVPPEERSGFASQLLEHLDLGDLVLLLDGYDELQRFDLGARLFLGLLNRCRLWVAAGRVERTQIPKLEGTALETLPAAWTDDLIEAYLQRRWGRPGAGPGSASSTRASWIAPAAGFFRGRATAAEYDWLRVPANLDAFFTVLENEHPADAGISAQNLEELARGQHELLYRIWRRVLERLKGQVTREEVLLDELGKIAEATWKGTRFSVPVAKWESNDEVCSLLRSMEEIVTSVRRRGETEHVDLQLTRQVLREFFLSFRIATQLESYALTDRLPLEELRWTRGMVAGTSAWLRGGRDPVDAEARLWKRLRSRERNDGDDTERGSGAANLLELAIRLRVDAAAAGSEEKSRRNVTIGPENAALQGLALPELDLRLIGFSRVSFDGCDLRGVDFRHARFSDCSFVSADLRSADARGAEFVRCRFRDAAGNPATLAIEGFRIEAYALEGNRGWDESDTLAADTSRWRYSGEFGRIFFQQQQGFTGAGHDALEVKYVEQIRDGLESYATGSARHASPQPLVVVDLMAGGSSTLLRETLGLTRSDAPDSARVEAPDSTPGEVRDSPPFVVAIDRDLSHLRPLLERNPPRFRALEMELGGAAEKGTEDEPPRLLWRVPGDPAGSEREFSLPVILEKAFPDHWLHCGLVIGKKAIHELRRELQPLLIQKCFDGLAPGGRLILFADSPEVPPDPDRYALLQDLRFRLLELARSGDPETAWQWLTPESLKLGDSDAEVAFFCNLWVALKDWANDNLRELRNRYFSSVKEILKWATDAGFEPVPGVVARADYHLAATRFNELGLQRVEDDIFRHGARRFDNSLARQQWANWLSGLHSPRFDIFRRFAERHLAPGTGLHDRLVDPATPSLSAELGEFVEGRTSNPVEGTESVAFRFPVHVLAFKKPKPKP